MMVCLRAVAADPIPQAQLLQLLVSGENWSRLCLVVTTAKLVTVLTAVATIVLATAGLHRQQLPSP